MRVRMPRGGVRVALAAAALCCVAWASARSVRVALRTSWNATSLLDEASEALAAENPDLFWSYAASSFVTASRTARDAYDLAMRVAHEARLSPTTVAILKASLAAHEFSAAVQAHYQVAREYSVRQAGCAAWVALRGLQLCTVAELQAALAHESSEETLDVPLGHVYVPKTPSAARLPVAVLYGWLGDDATRQLHEVLVQAAERGVVKYVFRHLPRPHVGDTRTFLTGYGVELAIKSTEYKAIDDTKATGAAAAPPPQASAPEQPQHDDEALPSTIAPISSAELPGLPLKLINKVLDSDDPLRTLRHLSQNLPSVAASLAALPEPRELSSEERQQIGMQMRWFQSSLTINGLRLSASFMDGVTAYSVLPVLRQECKRIEALVAAGLSLPQAVDLVTNSQPIADASSKGYVIDIRSAPVIFLNDVEKDGPYQRLPRSLDVLLSPMSYGGSMVFARLNLVTDVFTLSPARSEHWTVVLRLLQYCQRGVPMRFGLWFVEDDAEMRQQLATEASTTVEPRSTSVTVQFMRLLDAIQKERPASVFDFVREMARKVVQTGTVTTDLLRQVHRSAGVGDFDAIIAGDGVGTYDDLATQSNAAAVARGISADALFVNGQYGVLDPQFENEVSRMYAAQIDLLREMYLRREVSEDDNFYELLQTRPGVYPKMSTLINAGKNLWDGSEKPLPFMSLGSLLLLRPSSFLASTYDDAQFAITHVLVGDWADEANHRILAEALAYMADSTTARLLLVDTSSQAALTPLQRLIHALAEPATLRLRAGEAVAVLRGYLETHGDLDKTLAAIDPPLRDSASFVQAAAAAPVDVAKWRERQAELLRALGIAVPHAVTVITNGRVLADVPRDTFDRTDFALLEKFEYRHRVVPIEQRVLALRFPHVAAEEQGGRFFSDLLAIAVSAIGHNAKPRQPLMNLWPFPNAFDTGAPQDACVLRVEANLDPLSNDAQRLVGVLLMLREIDGVCLSVAMHTNVDIESLSVKRYYRYSYAMAPQFDAHGDVVPVDTVFYGLPSDLLLTLGIDDPQSWLVGSVAAVDDLDNLKLAPGDPRTVEATFELEKLILEGHSFETNTGFPPRGLQLVLGTPSRPAMADTIVMANYGYFQLQTNPGQWQLRLREGRSHDLYQFWTPGAASAQDLLPVVVESFVHDVVFAGVRKRPGHERDSLLVEDGGGESATKEPDSVWDSVKKSLFGKDANAAPASASNATTIHVFSLASGHLYERLLRIMILSLLRHTQHPVKFWFIHNFASPLFKQIIPLMADKYKFDYEFVTYKWPRWLRAQTEKQRIIWAYKILFLDVLFPLNVDRVIFVDADGIVRADVGELATMDLHGAPYGYTPFCDSRKETDGFRFWKSGWWQSHLRGQPYHISALYVIDLRRFREIAAGDRLRGNYQMLSSDANSLANLDQDLPNGMQQELPMFSLPQDWLFCETWCADDTLKTAKVIDLCNNPLTKEPKLAVAQRLLPEWNVYDQELRDFQAELSSTQQAPPLLPRKRDEL